MHQPPPIHFTQHPIHLPNSVREAMLQCGHEKGLLVADALICLKIAPDSWMTFKQIYHLLKDNCGTSRTLVYEALQQRSVFQRRKAPTQRNQRGAPPYYFRIPHAIELVEHFAPDGPDLPSDILSNADFKSVKAYRMALHHALFVRKWCQNDGQGFKMCRDLMADRLGVSKRTVRTYDQELGHSNTPNYIENRVHDLNLNDLPRYKARYDENGKRLPSRCWLRILDFEQGVAITLPFVRYLAYVALKRGHVVYRVEREANTYYPYRKPDVSQRDDWDVVSHYYAEMEAIKAAGLYQDDKGNWHYRRE